MAEQFDFGGYADGEEREGDHRDGETWEALGESDLRACGLCEKTAWRGSGVAQNGRLRFTAVDGSVWGRIGLVGGYGDPTAFAGPHKVEVLLRSGHFFPLMFLFDAVASRWGRRRGTKADVLNVPRFLRSNNGAKVSKTGTNGSPFEREEMQESNANWLPESGR